MNIFKKASVLLLTLCAIFALTALSAAAEDDTQIDPILILSSETKLTVTVDGTISASLSGKFPYGETTSITAPAVAEKAFLYWTNGNGEVISYAQSLPLTMYAHTTVNAVYGDTAETPTNLAAFTSISRYGDAIAFCGTGYATSGTVADSGVLYSTTARTLNALQALSPDDAIERSGNCWTLVVTPENEDTTYYAVAYAVVGNETYYSQVKTVKLSQLQSGISLVANLGDVTLPDNISADSFCNVSFDPNGGEGVMALQGVVKNSETALNVNTFTREGYTFNGWSTNQTGDGTTYTDGQTVTLSEDTTLYAQWKSNSSGGGNYSGGGTPTATTVTVPVSGDDETVNVKVEVKGDTATITSADVDKVLEAEDVGTVTIDVSALKQAVTEVVIPGAMVEKIADAVADEDNNADGLEIKLPTGTVSFDADAVATIAEQTEGKDLTLNLDDVKVTELSSEQQDAVKELQVEAVLDAYLTSNGQRISDFGGGKATVSVPYELKDDQIAQGLVVWYVADDGTKTQVPSTYDGKNIVFTVTHFSNYVVAYDAEKAAACPQDDTCPMSAFTDLNPALWYHDGIHFCLENGMMNGVGNNKFDPSGTTSRGMIVTILYRLENEPEITAENPFDDVEAGRWYTDAVIWAAENKIVDGYGGGKFGPNDDITREQLAVILYRYAQFKGIDVSVGEDTNILAFEDAGAWSNWSVDALQWAVGSGIINGKDGKLVPKGDAYRAEAATMIQRFCTLSIEDA